MKKLVAILLSALMVLSMSVSALAAPEAQTPDMSKHTYTAYQIFKGTQAEDSAELGNIEWGKDVDHEGILAGLDETVFAGCTSAADVAGVISEWKDDSEEARAFAKVVYANLLEDAEGTAIEKDTVLEAGYYLIVDTTEDEVDVYNLALIQMTNRGPVEIAVKVEVPQVEKKLSDETKLICTSEEDDHVHTAACYNWADSNNVAIGDTVHFKLESTVPEKISGYDYYYFYFEDTLSAGLTLNASSIKVFINGKLAEAGADKDYVQAVSVDDGTLKVGLVNAKAHAGKAVMVTYDAVLNENCEVGATGNPNEVVLKYSKNPNVSYDGGNKGYPEKDDTDVIGVTPKDFTITYTTQIAITKIDAVSGEVLPGVEFTLTGDALNVVLISEEKFVEDADGEYYKLKDGTYTKTAPVVSTTDKTGTEDKYESTETKYNREVELKPVTSSQDVAIKGVVDAEGKLTFTGLSDGKYTLVESKPLPGYNTIADIAFTIKWTAPEAVATGEDTCEWAVSVPDGKENNFDVDENGLISITIENQKGKLLPETGGMGTTVLYVVGAGLVIAAGIVLVLRKRASENK